MLPYLFSHLKEMLGVETKATRKHSVFQVHSILGRKKTNYSLSLLRHHISYRGKFQLRERTFNEQSN
jgi:hypothetical protein